MSELRAALETAQELYEAPRPLLTMRFKTDGRQLFIEELSSGQHVNLSERGQTAWKYVADVLREVRYDSKLISRWYAAGNDVPLFIDPRISFGRPVVEPQGVSTTAIAGRFAGGESLLDISEDFALPMPTIEAAIRFEHAPLLN